MEYRDYMRLVRRSWRLIVALTLTGIAAGAAMTVLSDRVYAASAEAFVSPASTGAGSAHEISNRLQSMMTSYAAAAESSEVLDPVRQKLKLSMSAEQLGERVTTTALRGTTVIDVTVLADSPQSAVRIADAVVAELPATLPRLDPALTETPPAAKITVIRSATPRSEPVSPAPLRNIGVAAVLGLLAGLTAAYVKDGRLREEFGGAAA
jgi:capsular polysaccharide biosynthesis protein